MHIIAQFYSHAVTFIKGSVTYQWIASGERSDSITTAVDPIFHYIKLDGTIDSHLIGCIMSGLIILSDSVIPSNCIVALLKISLSREALIISNSPISYSYTSDCVHHSKPAASNCWCLPHSQVPGSVPFCSFLSCDHLVGQYDQQNSQFHNSAGQQRSPHSRVHDQPRQCI